MQQHRHQLVMELGLFDYCDTDMLQHLPGSPDVEVYPIFDDGRPMKHFGAARGWEYEPICPIYYAQTWLDHIQGGDENPDLILGIKYMCGLIEKSLAPILPEDSRLALWSNISFPPFYDIPWWCCMSTGRVIELYARLFKHTNDERWLSLAKPLVDSLHAERHEGGTLFHDKAGGVFYESAVGFLPRMRVLNAHGSTLFSLYYWVKQTGDERTKALLKKGCVGFSNIISHFDPETKIGSLISQYSSGWLRFRASKPDGSNPGIGWHSASLSFPDDNSSNIEFSKNNGLGWELSLDTVSGAGSVETLDTHLVRKVAPRASTTSSGDSVNVYYLLVKTCLTLWGDDSDAQTLKAKVWAPEGTQVTAELYPSKTGGYIIADQAVADQTGWVNLEGQISMSDIAPPKAYGPPDHHYHHLNASYTEFVYWLFPDMPNADIAKRWCEQANASTEATFSDNQLFWWSGAQKARRWNPEKDSRSI